MSLQSAARDFDWSRERRSERSSSSIQKRVSEHSLSEILHFARKSLRDAAWRASARFAPMLVPLRRIWSARENSFLTPETNRHTSL